MHSNGRCKQKNSETIFEHLSNASEARKTQKNSFRCQSRCATNRNSAEKEKRSQSLFIANGISTINSLSDASFLHDFTATNLMSLVRCTRGPHIPISGIGDQIRNKWKRMPINSVQVHESSHWSHSPSETFWIVVFFRYCWAFAPKTHSPLRTYVRKWQLSSKYYCIISNIIFVRWTKRITYSYNSLMPCKHIANNHILRQLYVEQARVCARASVHWMSERMKNGSRRQRHPHPHGKSEWNKYKITIGKNGEKMNEENNACHIFHPFFPINKSTKETSMAKWVAAQAKVSRECCRTEEQKKKKKPIERRRTIKIK